MSMRKYDNFCKALKNLKECQKYQEPYSTVTETGLVALFEICFEQAWKTMKACLQEHGYEEGRTGSPKMVIKVAYQAGMTLVKSKNKITKYFFRREGRA